MKKFSILCLVLALVMLAACFAGCGGAPEPAASPADANAPAAEPEAPAAETPAAEEPAAEAPASDYEYVKSNGQMVIGYTDYEPINYYDENGELIGFDTEMAKAVCEKLGVEAKFVEILWDTKEVELDSFKIDCIWNGMTYTEERDENMDFAHNYLYNKIVLVVNKANAEKYTTLDSFKDALVVSESGSSGEECVLAQMPDCNYNPVANLVTSLTEVAAGTADAAAVDSVMAYYLVGEGIYEDLIVIDSITLAQEELGIGFRTGSDLVEKVNTALDELVADGTYAAIGEKYGLTDILMLG